MNEKIEWLSRLIRRNKKEGKPYLLILGPGASLNSGDTSIQQIMESIADTSDYDEFYSKLSNFDSGKLLLLAENLESIKPPAGYRSLAQLIRDGYFDIILTTNFDTFLENSLIDAGLREDDFAALINGHHEDEEIIEQLYNPEPRVKIFKLHGDFHTRIFIDSKEILQFSKEIENTLRRYLSKRDVIIFGHSMLDFDLNRCLAAKGGDIWFVNVTPPDDSFQSIIKVRKSADNVIYGGDAMFKSFWQELMKQIKSPHPFDEERLPPPEFPNPYNYTEVITDPKMFFGRGNELERIHHFIKADKPQNCSILGYRKTGRSSLLQQIYQQREEPEWKNYIFVYLHIQEMGITTPNSFISEILSQIHHESDGKLTVTPKLPDIFTQFRRCIQKWSRKHKFIILIDDFQKLVGNFEWNSKFFEGLGALADHPRCNLAYIVTTQNDLFELFKKDILLNKSIFFNKFPIIHLGLLEDDAARKLIQVSHERCGLTLEESDVKWILRLAGHHPLYLQMLCFHVFDMKSRGLPLDEATKKEIRMRFEREARRWHYPRDWGRLTFLERTELLRLTCGENSDVVPNPTKEQLLDNALIDFADGHYLLDSLGFARFIYEQRRKFPEFERKGFNPILRTI